MPFKETKRKGFNFFRSYFDVYNELESDKDKLIFIDALLMRQFLGVKPEKLEGQARFAYISQVNSIDSQVKGYEDKTGIILTPLNTPPRQGGKTTPAPQVEEKEKEKEKEQWFIDWFNNSIKEVKGKKGKYKLIDKVRRQLHARIKEGYSSDNFKDAFDAIKENEHHKKNDYRYLTPEFITRPDMLEKWSNAEIEKPNNNAHLFMS